MSFFIPPSNLKSATEKKMLFKSFMNFQSKRDREETRSVCQKIRREKCIKVNGFPRSHVSEEGKLLHCLSVCLSVFRRASETESHVSICKCNSLTSEKKLLNLTHEISWQKMIYFSFHFYGTELYTKVPTHICTGPRYFNPIVIHKCNSLESR